MRGRSATNEPDVGDTAVTLLKEGADFTIKNSEDMVPLDLAPDKEVCIFFSNAFATVRHHHSLGNVKLTGANTKGTPIYNTRIRTGGHRAGR